MTLALAMARKKVDQSIKPPACRAVRPPARVRHCRRKSSGSHTSELQCAFHSPLSVSPSAMSPGLALVQQSSLDPDRAGQLEPRRDEFMRVRAVAVVGATSGND